MAELGTIKTLVQDKGYGFIRAANGGTEYFFHRSAVQGADFVHLQEGQRVLFDITTTPKGPRAENVELEES